VFVPSKGLPVNSSSLRLSWRSRIKAEKMTNFTFENKGAVVVMLTPRGSQSTNLLLCRRS
jgi:hypothetical protein